MTWSDGLACLGSAGHLVQVSRLRKHAGREHLDLAPGAVHRWRLQSVRGGGRQNGPDHSRGPVGDLVQGLVLLRDDGRLRYRLGKAGERRLPANYSPAAMAEAFRTVYEDVIDWHARQE